MSKRSVATCGLVVGLLTGCYDASLDPLVGGVYVCEEESDCALGSTCIDGVCELTEAAQVGPRIRIVDPSPLAVYAMEDAPEEIGLMVASDGLRLEDEGDGEPGYLEISLDGAVIETVSSGDLSEAVAVPSILTPPEPGLHHVTVNARRLDGRLFEGVASRASVAFWVDDGREHVGILEPPAGSTVPFGDSQGFRVEVASLNFTFVNPGFIGDMPIDGLKEGYLHLYIDADVPTCLPECNFDYQSSVIPAGLSRVNQMVVERPVRIPDGLRSARIQIVAQNLGNTPYHRDPAVGDFVYHTVPVQSTISVTP